MPDIKVLRVEVKHSEQYGDKKILHIDDGSKWNVAEKKPFYKDISGPGIYYADFKDFQGKPYIAYLKFKGALDGQNQATAGSQAVMGTGTPSAAQIGLKERLAADKKRQDDIRLEFYCGIAKDILVANKKDGEDINHNEVIAIGLDLYKKHLDVLEMLQAQAAGMEQAKQSQTGTQYSRAKAALEADKAAEEDPPF